MIFIDSYSIKTKLFFVIISISAISLVFFSIFALNKYNEYYSFKEIVKATEVSIKSAELIHELQIERGMSAGFLNSKGSKFKSELNEQRIVADDKIVNFKKSIENHFSANDKNYKLMESSLKELDNLNSLRNDIDGFNISAIQQIKSYTAKIKSLLDLLNEIKDLSSEFSEIRNTSISLFNFAWYKEYMGQLRATLNSAFVKNKLDMETYKNFTQRYYAANVYLNTFKDYSESNLLIKLNEYEEKDNYSFVKSAFELSLNSPNSDSLNINASVWFSNITGYIDNLRLIEKNISDEIIETATAQSNKLFINLIIILVITIIVIIFIYILAYKIISQLIKNINIAYKRAINISEGII